MTGIDLADQVAVVTGAGSGLGRETAMALSGFGAAVVAADIDAEAVAATEAAISAAGGRAVSEVVDVARKADVDALAERAGEVYGRIDSWVNSAGIMRTQRAVDISEADLDAVLQVNLKGVMFGCQAAVGVMGEQGSGSIVNVVSAIVDAAVPGMIGYAVSKAAAAMYTKCLAVEVGRSGVRVNAVAPGWTVTSMTRRHAADAAGSAEALDDDAIAAIAAKQARIVPLGRLAEPSDVADAIVYLVSDLSCFLTGQILRPHGGVTMPW